MATLFLALALTSFSYATEITSRQESELHPGVTLVEIRTADPACDVVAVYVDLCNDFVHIDATAPTDRLRSTAAWAASVGAQVALNGDFYKSGPVRVYGDAVGSGVRWPEPQTGRGQRYSFEWFHHRYGWIAFGPGRVDFTHTEWVKQNAGDDAERLPDLSAGWANDEVAPDPPAGTVALVSGFPELVTEGQVRTCDDPRRDSCFPDRGDMKDRHPRSAMGLTEDLDTFLLVAVDGRSARSAGMRGAELAWLMGELGAWQAFNVDGGGSTQLWLDADGGGYANSAGSRAVANHWAVFAGAGGGRARNPGHCSARRPPPPDPEAEPCPPLPAEGGTLDDSDPNAGGDCLVLHGPDRFWRRLDDPDAALGGGLRWTNGFVSEDPSNWARWQVRLSQPGRYLVQWHAVPRYAVFNRVRHRVRADGRDHDLTIDQGAAAAGWNDLGTFDFAGIGGADGEWVDIYDHGEAPIPADQHIVVDGLRLLLADPPNGEPSPEPDPRPDPMPAPAPEPEPEPEPSTDPDPSPAPEPSPEPAPAGTADDDSQASGGSSRSIGCATSSFGWSPLPRR